ncbi:schlafen 3, isoform CRA_b [Rattus norvegicus]|uniref:Schlafen 3, isoform CRA_b n=3 Tax=Rattus norvegicus TaxID=10116 RepID=A0A0G2K750_RAT|nr:schlafen family member 4 [Rattus norvegicus]XP_008766155.1 schlafen family member 4 isoform X1 [Rattus norvegicus]XP_038940959.1 schlafen family member 4 isoform X1 [Rattus norvegicus]XP_038940960.1 schlafen family member 4 isoform X1 [Rattus norvegicus]AAD45931.1 schlafen-4 [Rattus norvegicus]EDM05467.1 schlafen 3, isoform CRA_b [Rattus norvegicus]|eukprot:NP_446139.1 schlafen 4 [Rattus norvegicus]
MSITVDQDTDYAELVLSIGEITLGEKTRKSMKDSQRRKREAKTFQQAVCTLLNSGGGVAKARIKNQNYDFSRDGVGQDLENFLPHILDFPHEYLDFKQVKDYFLMFVKAWKLKQKGPGITTLKTNLYIRSISSSIELKAVNAVKFLKSRKCSKGRSDSRLSSPGTIVCNEVLNECLNLFNRDCFTCKEKFCFTKATHAEVKLTPKENILEILPQTVSSFANADGGYLFIGLDGKTQEIIGFEAEKSDLVHLESEIEKCIRQLPVTHFCEEREKIKYTCKFMEVHKPGAACSFVCALRVERFCCAVFAAEPESWHVEDSCVKRFTAEDWVKRQMDGPACFSKQDKGPLQSSRLPHSPRSCCPDNPDALQQSAGLPVISGKVISSPEALCGKLFSTQEAHEQLLWAQLDSLPKGTLVVTKRWALDLPLQDKHGVILDTLHIPQDSLLTLHGFVLGGEDLEDDSTLLRELGAELKGYYKQTAVTLKQTLANHGSYTEKIGIAIKITYLGHNKAVSLYDSSSKIHYPTKYYLTTETAKNLEKALAEILGSRESFYSLPRQNCSDHFIFAFFLSFSFLLVFLFWSWGLNPEP